MSQTFADKPGFRFSAQESAFVRDHYALMPTEDIAKKLNRPVRAIRSHAHMLGIKKVEKAVRQKSITGPLLEVLELMYPVMSNADLSELLGVSESLVKYTATEYGIKKDLAFRKQQLRVNAKHGKQFKPGQQPWNAGIADPSHPYHKRGHPNPRKLPVGTLRERIKPFHDGSRHSYLHMRTETDWVPFAQIMWEEYHQRSLPKGLHVYFKNGDRLDFSKDNLVAITREELVICTGRYQAPLELLPLVKKSVQISRAIKEISKKTASQGAFA